MLRPLQFVSSPNEIREAVSTFNQEARFFSDTAKSLITSTTYWVYDPESSLFGPSKFVAFQGMDFNQYSGQRARSPGNPTFVGARTRKAIESVLGAKYLPNADRTAAFRTWVEDLFGLDLVKRVNSGRWRFISLAGRRYFAVVADPNEYRVADAARELEEGTWTITGGNPEPGDRIAV